MARLTDRRLAVQRELSALGDAKKGSQDVFRHCRGFERAFQVMLNEANVAFKVRAVVEGNLPETLRKIPIEKRFNKNYTREVSFSRCCCPLRCSNLGSHIAACAGVHRSLLIFAIMTFATLPSFLSIDLPRG